MLEFPDRLVNGEKRTPRIRANKVEPASGQLWGMESIARNRAEIDADPLIPEYMKKVYYWAYLNPRNVRMLDRETVVKTILWFQHHKLQQAAFNEIQPGENVLQPASVYGDFCPNLARHIGPAGKLEIIDVAPVQVLACRAKMAHLPQVRVRRGNAAQLGNHLYDAVCCYFLLHEVPLEYKYAIVQELLDRVRPSGKVIFVDYRKPHWAHPLKLVTSIVFDTLEPFAKDLWHLAIEEFAEGDPRFVWRRQNYFAGLFQKVVARRVR